jgi:hypothetical protein
MKALVCLPTSLAAWLVEHLVAYIGEQEDVLRAMEADGTLTMNNLLETSADTYRSIVQAASTRAAVERSLSDMPDPAQLQHCQLVYREMLQAARLVKEEDVSIVVYEGPLTHLIITELGLPNPYYTSITQALVGMGCAKQLKRGGGGQPSQWELITDPTRERYDEYMTGKGEDVEPEPAASVQMVKDLSNRVTVLEKALGVTP